MTSQAGPSGHNGNSSAAEDSSSNTTTARPSDPVNLASVGQASDYPYSLSSAPPDPFSQQDIHANTQDWFSQQNISPDQQVQLPESFFTDWPFSMGQGEAFNFLGDLQGQPQGLGPGAEVGADGPGSSQPHGQGQGDGQGGIQDILGVGMPEGFVGNGQIGGVLGSLGFSGGQ
jgi:hypothetical protein